MYRKLISAGLSISILFGTIAFTGCKKKTKKKGFEGVRTISADSTWFDAKMIEIDDVVKDKKATYSESSIIGAYHGGLVVRMNGYESPDNKEFNELCYFDPDGKLINTIDLLSAVSADDSSYVTSIIGDDRVYLYREDCDVSGVQSYYLTTVDLETGVIGEFEKLPYTSKDIPNYCEDVWVNGDYLVSSFRDIGSNRRIFAIYKNGQSKIADLTSALPSEEIAMITGCIPISEKEILLVCSYSDVNFISLNLDTGKIQLKDEEYSWLNKLTSKEDISSFDGKSYITDQGGVKRINMGTKQLEDIVSFDNCNLNRAVMDDVSLYSAQEDTYIFAGSIAVPDSRNEFNTGNSAYTPTIITLKKADKNPHAGKAVITAAAVGNADVPYPICEAIRLFNDTNDDYYVQLQYNYDIIKGIDYSKAQTEDDTDNIYYKTAADLNDLLAINMLSGAGPDIILNAGSVRQIQTEKHLLDLSSYMSEKSGIRTEDYFSNVFDAAKKDGKLLFMPISFEVIGLSVNKADVSDGQKGFTYDEYVKYMDEVCGFDPMSDTRLGVLCTLYSCMSDPCIHGTQVNFDTPSFRRLCEYVKNNLSEKSSHDWDHDENASYSAFSTFLSNNTYLSPKKTLLGYPSSDACGPVISVDISIGISAMAPSAVADGAWEFIRSCLGDDVQTLIARGYTNPMNKSIFDSTAKEVLERYNHSEASLGIAIDESVITSYKDILQSASVLEGQDPAVLNIIREEIPAYFLDQKSLDEVLGIINNRVSTLVKERA